MSDDPIARTRAGALRGVVRSGIEVFRGIPYARPPRAALRLQPPQPVTSWSGTLDARQFGASPPQTPDPLSDALGLLHGCRFDEDCLQLNVYTPGRSGQRPVLVWIQGGAFQGGSACVPLYDGCRLAARGDLVVVTFNYRVGALGWSALAARGARPAVANLGLQDQLAALRWVRRNISAFGGDPQQVTAFGESAGAGSLLALAGVPAAEGLFRRAIVQSAAPRGAITLAEAHERSARLLERLGGGPEALWTAPLEQVLAAQAACIADGPHRTGMFYTPVPDDQTLALEPCDAFARGWARDVALLIGTTRDEMRLYHTGWPESDQQLAAVIGAQLPAPVRERAGACRRLIEGFRSARAARAEPVGACDLFLAIQTELSLRYDAIRIAEARAPGDNTWMYLFSWPSPWRDGLVGACHALDLPFVFGNLDAPGMPAFAGEGEAVRSLSHAMMDAWIAFARTGRPGGDGLGAWPVYTAGERATMELGPECGTRNAPRDPERRLLAEIFG